MKIAAQYYRVGFATFVSLVLTGCPTIRMPDFHHPGSAGYQRANALQFDPYPLDDVAPPVAGARPKEYDRPIPEVERGQAFTPKRPNLRPIAFPPFAPTAAPVVTTPPGATVSPFAPPPNVPYRTMPLAPPPASSTVRPPY